MELVIPNRLATLGHPQRLALFRLLMRRYPDRVPATELAQALGMLESDADRRMKIILEN